MEAKCQTLEKGLEGWAKHWPQMYPPITTPHDELKFFVDYQNISLFCKTPVSVKVNSSSGGFAGGRMGIDGTSKCNELIFHEVKGESLLNNFFKENDIPLIAS
ncbi:hypothetical protein Tco_1482157 [Tanacetum coccineum]